MKNLPNTVLRLQTLDASASVEMKENDAIRRAITKNATSYLPKQERNRTTAIIVI